MYLVTAKEMQTMDRQTIDTSGIPGQILMENAGRGATQMLLEKFQALSQKRIGILSGRGNNGGDGFVMARYLAESSHRVCVYLLSEKSKVKGDAKTNLMLLDSLEVPVVEVPDKKSFQSRMTAIRHEDIWIDAILGTGLTSDVRGYFKDVIEFINQSRKPVFAVDIPSGLNSDTGRPRGVCIRAHATATFGFAKIGHLLYPGADCTGDLGIIDIGIPPHIVREIGPRQTLLTPDIICNAFKPRAPDAHKGTTGHALIVAGSPGKTGAAAMAATSAMRAGAGLVTLGLPAGLNAVVEPMVLEAMTVQLDETENGSLAASSAEPILSLLEDKDCLAIGPGLGTGSATKDLISEVISKASVPMVIDADGLNALAGNTGVLLKVNAPVILTPHPGEMARLMDSTPEKVQADRVACAREFAQSFRTHLILKGARTVIAHPDGRVIINPTGNPGMAAGGMGDVLTGLIAGLLAQGYSPQSSAHLAVWLHGAAADALSQTKGPVGFLASEVMAEIPTQIKRVARGMPLSENVNPIPTLLGL